MQSLAERLPYWSWIVEGSVHATSILPELLGMVGLVALFAIVVWSLRRRGGGGSFRESWRVLVALSGAFCLIVSWGAAMWFAYEERRAEGIMLFGLGVASGGFVAGALLATVARTIRPATLPVAFGAALVALVPAAHAAWIAAMGFTHLGVDGSHLQHVGTTQRIEARVYDDRWTLVRAGGTVRADRAGVEHVRLEAVRGLERVQIPFDVHIGEEIGDPRFPLAEGSEWDYRVHRVGAEGPAAVQTLRATAHEDRGGYRAVRLQGIGVDSWVVALDGALYVEHDGDLVPFSVEHEDDAGSRYQALQLDCGSYLAADGDFELPGPTRCRGERTSISGGGVLAIIFTLGLAAPLVTDRYEITAELIRSRASTSPAFVIPTHKPVPPDAT
ncbi:MAG: hypothetical protein AB7S26_29595 [Sandaracinaceae bacterium]